MATAARRICPACGVAGDPVPLMEGRDRMLHVPGTFAVTGCRSCGLGTTEPPMTDEELAEYYPASYPAYVDPGGKPSLRVKALDRLDAARLGTAVHAGAFGEVARRPPGRLLDVGCGRGELAAWFIRHGWSAAGVEPSSEAAAQAKARGVDVHRGTLDDAAFDSATFDAVTFNHALEHVPDPQSALRRARELLVAEGLLAVSVPNFGSWQRRAFGSRWFHLDLPRHRHHFTARALRALAERSGFEVVATRSSPSLAGLPGSTEYALLGEHRLSDRMFFYAIHAFSPVTLGAGLVGNADSLHLVARAR